MPYHKMTAAAVQFVLYHEPNSVSCYNSAVIQIIL